jgi:RNA-directed DNA polymerase
VLGEEARMLGRAEQRKLVTDLRVMYAKCKEKNLLNLCEMAREALSEANIGLEPDNLGEIRPLMKVILGYDPLGRDTRPKGEKQIDPTRSEAQGGPSLQDLRRRIYTKAKAEPAKRFWGLYVHVLKMETLWKAYEMAKGNNGAPGIDGVTFAAIEESGVEAFLKEIRDELVKRSYRPLRNRKKEIPKEGGANKTRLLSIPAIRDRVVQGALKLILEPIFEADFQPGSFGYRPKRTAHEAVHRVNRAILKGMTRVIDLDLRSYFDNVLHYILLEKVAKRVQDDDVMHLLKLILKASGKKGVPQGGVISPLLSNIYLNEVDKMLERAKDVTREGKYTHIEYARFADDVVILVDGHRRQDWLLKAAEKRLREELAKLEVAVNEEKTEIVDLAKGESFGFLGFQFRRLRSPRKRWWVMCVPKMKKRTALLRKLKDIFRRFESQPIKRVVDLINPILRGWVNYFRIGNSGRCFSYVRLWVEKKIRRHLMRARKRRGFGWKRWSTEWIYQKLGLYGDYQIRYVKQPKALPCQ